jgi:hypothetical protein
MLLAYRPRLELRENRGAGIESRHATKIPMSLLRKPNAWRHRRQSARNHPRGPGDRQRPPISFEVAVRIRSQLLPAIADNPITGRTLSQRRGDVIARTFRDGKRDDGIDFGIEYSGSIGIASARRHPNATPLLCLKSKRVTAFSDFAVFQSGREPSQHPRPHWP